MKNILLAVTGMSPQIVTETLYALVTQRNFIPSEIHVITTVLGKNRIMADLLDSQSGQFYSFCREYDLVDKIMFNEDCIHLIADDKGQALPDIRTPQENELAANGILNFVREWCAKPNTCLHVSIAGGRKSMGFYLGYALSLYARSQDSASHVLVNSPFEGLAEFFYPPKQSTTIVLRDGSIVHSHDAKVMLADIPIVKLRAGLPNKLLNGSQSYSLAVDIAQESLAPDTHLRFCADVRQRTIYLNDKPCELPPKEFALLHWFAQCALVGKTVNIRSNDSVESYLKIYEKLLPLDSEKLVNVSRFKDEGLKDFIIYFSETKSKLKRVLRNEYGSLSKFCEIVTRRRKNVDEYGSYALNTPAACIVFD